MPTVSPGLPDYDPQHAPEDVVRLLAAAFAPRRSPSYPTAEQDAAHFEQARRWADTIWAEAYNAGAVHGMRFAREHENLHRST